ncbi:sortase B protein-sorting domain-containing protein [Bacillus mycoides]|nr:sortase B protein-sorting domain-containing protein [Bacillus mycoides]
MFEVVCQYGLYFILILGSGLLLVPKKT